MRTPKGITHIVIHCSAGFGNRASIEAFWKSKGWDSPGYHRLIDLDGTVHKLLDFGKTSNGVLGHNEKIINICYIGGVEKKGDKYIAKDTRTLEQRCAIQYCIAEAQGWLKNQGNTNKIIIQGHRDFSPDKNGNGVIDSWERIKECPSFDAKNEYQ